MKGLRTLLFIVVGLFLIGNSFYYGEPLQEKGAITVGQKRR